jgi:1-acyl-sn-glycerol-3-phosphate acyltransferase
MTDNASQDGIPHLTWFNWIVLTIMIIIGRTIETFLTRTRITGKEYLKTEGPAIVVANHASTYDAGIIRMHMPRTAFFVGPGDFKLALGGTWIIRNTGVILVNRGTVDLKSLKIMENALKNGGVLALFPEGGTWEKTIEDVKPGAAYLSAQTGAKLIPMAISGTYRVWYKILRFKFPHVEVKIGEPLPPVQLSGNRKTRQEELQQASVDIMRKIYDMLPPEDQARYDEVARQQFAGTLTTDRDLETLTDTSADGLAELVCKPNLFAPLKMNAGDAIAPLTSQRGTFVAAAEMRTALQTLDHLLSNDFKGYLEYRLGDEKSQKIYAELKRFSPIAGTAQETGIKLKFEARVELIET